MYHSSPSKYIQLNAATLMQENYCWHLFQLFSFQKIKRLLISFFFFLFSLFSFPLSILLLYSPRYDSLFHTKIWNSLHLCLHQSWLLPLLLKRAHFTQNVANSAVKQLLIVKLAATLVLATKKLAINNKDVHVIVMKVVLAHRSVTLM